MTAEERKTAVRQAIANQRLEGGEVSPETRKLSEDYISGKISADELSRQVKLRYGVKCLAAS